MAYNLLVGTDFNLKNWNLINCKLEGNILTSTSKVFGIEQELTLANPTKLYFRVHYKAFNNIKEVKIGVQNKRELGIDSQVPKLNKLQKISVIEYAKQEKIKLHLIFESDTDVNKVLIQEPILVDINHLNKSTWVKGLLDKVIKFRSGYQYNNLYETSEITKDLDDFKNFNLEEAKIGSILTTKENIETELKAKFIKGNTYLAKLNYEEINKFGSIKFQYGFLKSTTIEDQIYLVFKANENNTLKLVVEAGEVLPYQINLKNILLINITPMSLLREDIPYLPFI